MLPLLALTTTHFSNVARLATCSTLFIDEATCRSQVRTPTSVTSRRWMSRLLSLDSMIVLSVDPSLLYLIGDREDPVAVLKLLSEQFQIATWANKLALCRRLHSLWLKEGESVQDHVKAITEIFNELSVIGDNMQDEDE